MHEEMIGRLWKAATRARRVRSTCASCSNAFTRLTGDNLESFHASAPAAHAVARHLIDCGCVAVRTDEPFRLPSGWASPVYMDARRLISFPRERRDVVAHGIGLLERQGCLEGSHPLPQARRAASHWAPGSRKRSTCRFNTFASARLAKPDRRRDSPGRQGAARRRHDGSRSFQGTVRQSVDGGRCESRGRVRGVRLRHIPHRRVAFAVGFDGARIGHMARRTRGRVRARRLLGPCAQRAAGFSARTACMVASARRARCCCTSLLDNVGKGTHGFQGHRAALRARGIGDRRVQGVLQRGLSAHEDRSGERQLVFRRRHCGAIVRAHIRGPGVAAEFADRAKATLVGFNAKLIEALASEPAMRLKLLSEVATDYEWHVADF